ncbi:MAG: transaldolase family protein [Acidimicrobiales bacterium]
MDAPNLYIKVPGTVEGIGAIRTLVSEGRSINVTLIFSLERYAEVMEAYISGLEACPLDDLSTVSSVASFFISRVDAAVDAKLVALGTDEALALKGKAAIAQGQIAYERFQATFSGERWDALAARGARQAAALGLDIDERSVLPRHALCRHAHRSQYGQHAA